MTERKPLLNRRSALNTNVEHRGVHLHMTVGHYATGEIGEIFLNADRADSLLDTLISDAAIIASIALQFGCPLDAIRHALKRDARGVAASPIGAALDKIR
jgi:ribonucleoside-diphosphate reductase alpha chain